MKLTDYLAAYGALLSTAVAVWNVFRALPKIRVFLVFSVDRLQGEPRHGITISIQNPSAHTVHITNVSFLYQYKSETLRDRIKHFVRFKRLPHNLGWCHSALSNFGINDNCPISIEARRSHSIFVSDDMLEKLLSDAVSRNIKVVVQDELWRNKYSKRFEYL